MKVDKAQFDNLLHRMMQMDKASFDKLLRKMMQGHPEPAKAIKVEGKAGKIIPGPTPQSESHTS